MLTATIVEELDLQYNRLGTSGKTAVSTHPFVGDVTSWLNTIKEMSWKQYRYSRKVQSLILRESRDIGTPIHETKVTDENCAGTLIAMYCFHPIQIMCPLLLLVCNRFPRNFDSSLLLLVTEKTSAWHPLNIFLEWAIVFSETAQKLCLYCLFRLIVLSFIPFIYRRKTVLNTHNALGTGRHFKLLVVINYFLNLMFIDFDAVRPRLNRRKPLRRSIACLGFCRSRTFTGCVLLT